MNRILTTLAVGLCSVMAALGAVPDYKSFRGTGGITIVSNPPNGTIVIDGSGISGAFPSYALTNNDTRNINLIGTLTNRAGSIYIEDLGEPGVQSLWLSGTAGSQGIYSGRDIITIGFPGRGFQIDSNFNAFYWANQPYGDLGYAGNLGINRVYASNILTAGSIQLGALTAGRITRLNGSKDATNSTAMFTTLDDLVDPNADRILFWDDSAGLYTYLTAGSGLSIAGTTITATGGAGTPGGSSRDIQFNLDGAFFGTNRFTYDRTNDNVSLTFVDVDGVTNGFRVINESASQYNKYSALGVEGSGSFRLSLNGSGPGATTWSFSNAGDLIPGPANLLPSIGRPGGSEVKLNSLSISNKNFIEQVPTNGTATTFSIDWNGPRYVRYAPAGTFTLSFVNTPSAGDPSRIMQMDLLTQQSGSFPAGIDWGLAGAPFIASGAATNTYWFDWTGSNVVGRSEYGSSRWTSDIDGAGYSLTNVFKLSIGKTNVADSGTQNPSIVISSTNSAGQWVRTRHRWTNSNELIDFSINGGAYSAAFTLGSDGRLTTASHVLSGGVVEAAFASSLQWSSRSAIFSPANSVIQMMNSAATDFSRLIWGSNHVAHPAILKTNGHLRLTGGTGVVGSANTNAFYIDGGTYYVSNTIIPSVTQLLGAGGYWVGNSNGFLVTVYTLDGSTTAMKVLAP